MITVTKYIDGVPAVVVRSDDETSERLPGAWHNGEFVHLSIAGFEIAMPPATWERVWREIRHALENHVVPPPLSVTGKNAADLRTVDVATFADPDASPVVVESPYAPQVGA